MKHFVTFASTVSLLVAILFTVNSCKKTFDAPPGPSDPGIVANTTIATLKALHTVPGVFDLVTSDIIVSGVVTANDQSGNLYKEIYIQDSTGAIRILLNATGLYNSFPVGRTVYVLAKDLYLSDDAGNIEIGAKSVVAGTPTLEGILSPIISNYVKGGTLGSPVAPTVVTISQLGGSLQDPTIGKLIQLNDFQFTTPGRTYGDTSAYKAQQNDSIKDCASPAHMIIVRTSAYATFTASPVPQGNGSIVALYVPYHSSFSNTRQLLLRDSSDVQFTGQRCGGVPPGTIILLGAPNPNPTHAFDFEGIGAAASPGPYPTTIPGWQNLSEAGSRLWDLRVFSGNGFANLSAFGSGQANVTTWLVSPAINLNATTGEVLTFKTLQGHLLTVTPGGTNVAAALKVLISTDYTGTGNPWTTGTWTDITSQAILSPGSTTSSFPASFTNSGPIPLSSYSGTAHIAFKYVGSDPAKTSTWELDDILITGQ